MYEEMIRRAQQGDTTAFRALVEAYMPGAWRVARILVTDRGQAEDAMQEAWIDVWRGLPRYDVGRPFRPWLLAIVGNRCRMLGRRHAIPTQSLGEDLADTLLDPHDAYAEVAAREPDATLRNALACLSAEARELLELRYQAELELAEIAETLRRTTQHGQITPLSHTCRLARAAYQRRACRTGFFGDNQMTTPHDPTNGDDNNPTDPALEARLAAHFRTQAQASDAPLDGEAFWERLAPRLEPRTSLEADTVAPSSDTTPVRRRGTTVTIPDDMPAPPAHGSHQRARDARHPRRAINNLLAVAAVLALCLSAFALFHQLSAQQLGKSVLMRRGELTWRRVTLPLGVVLTNGEGVTMTNGSGTPIISGAVKNAPTPNATLQVTPSDGNVAYICQLAGQGNPHIWRTTDAGQHWTSLATLHIIGNIDTCFLGFDANNPLTVIATFVRSAENGSAHGRVSYALFDGASQWLALGSDQTMGSVASWGKVYYGIGNLTPDAPTQVDPNGKPQDQPQWRLYESSDEMRTWHELNDAALIAENIASSVKTKAIGPVGSAMLMVQPNTGELLAQTTNGVLWRSSDHGQNWARILLPSLPPATN